MKPSTRNAGDRLSRNPRRRRRNASQLRADIDAGRTRDKVRAPDPAAAPLGTDEEAAGTPQPPLEE